MRLAARDAGAPSAAPDDVEVEWPDDSDESSYLSEASARGETPRAPGPLGGAPMVGEKFPPLDTLVARVPPALMGLLDDLFRAKFTGVRKFATPPPGPAAGRDRGVAGDGSG